MKIAECVTNNLFIHKLTNNLLEKNNLLFVPEFYDRYIDLVDDVPASQALLESSTIFEDVVSSLEALEDRIYAPGKWTAKDILQHCIDTERILAYRALCFARNDSTVLPGFDEADYARYTLANERTLPDLLEEFSIVRTSTVFMFENFSEEMLLKEGIANGKRISVLALGLTIAGHAIHHLRILEERYFPLI